MASSPNQNEQNDIDDMTKKIDQFNKYWTQEIDSWPTFDDILLIKNICICSL